MRSAVSTWDPLSEHDAVRVVQERMIGELAAMRRATLAAAQVGLGRQIILGGAGVELAAQTGRDLVVVDVAMAGPTWVGMLNDCGVEYTVCSPQYALAHGVDSEAVLVVSLGAISPVGKTGALLAELAHDRECMLVGYHAFEQARLAALIGLVEYADGSNRVELSMASFGV